MKLKMSTPAQLLRQCARSLFYGSRRFLQSAFNRLLAPTFHLIVVESIDIWAATEVLGFLTSIPTRCRLRRVGGSGDGGYFVPDDLAPCNKVFSPGYGGCKSFEDDLAAEGLHTFTCDPGYSELEGLLSNQSFECFRLAPCDDKVLGLRSLRSWVSSHATDAERNLVLQMDVEGAEWDILSATPQETLERFEVVLIELHDLDQLFFSSFFAEKVLNVVEKLSASHHVVHANANNYGGCIWFGGVRFPKVVEITLARTDCLLRNQIDSADREPRAMRSQNSRLHPPLEMPSARDIERLRRSRSHRLAASEWGRPS